MWRTLLLLLMFARVTFGGEVAGGLSIVEEGDDRLRPGVLIEATHDEWGFLRLHHYGRRYGPIVEKGGILSASLPLDIFRPYGMDFFRMGIGVSVLYEMTQIRIPGANDRDDNVNLGLNGGFYAKLPLPAPFTLKLGWESHIFPAGFGAILLANGRKQVISLVSGVSF